MKDKVILLVEDNPDDEALTLHALEANKIGNRVVVLRDGAEALDYLLARGPHERRAEQEAPTLVLLDLKLPKVDGLEVLRQLRANESTAFIPVVVLTSSREQEDRLKAYSLGANSYVRKPVDFDEFIKATQQLGMYWLLLNEPAQG